MITSIALAIQLACVPYQIAIDNLWNKWQEVVVSSGVTKEGYIVEVTANTETGTWSILMTKPMGLTCLMTYGDGWRKKVSPGGEDA